jgi:hypothetical protein
MRLTPVVCVEGRPDCFHYRALLEILGQIALYLRCAIKALLLHDNFNRMLACARAGKRATLVDRCLRALHRSGGRRQYTCKVFDLKLVRF